MRATLGGALFPPHRFSSTCEGFVFIVEEIFGSNL